MNRPYVFCHMMCALDGKIMGGYMGTPQGRAAGDAFYDIAFGKEPFYHHRGWLSGRVTTDDNFTYQHRVGGGGRREPGYAAGFPSRRRHFGSKALGFTLKEAKAMDGGAVWLRYGVNR